MGVLLFGEALNPVKIAGIVLVHERDRGAQASAGMSE
jgi:hypothetical protein